MRYLTAKSLNKSHKLYHKGVLCTITEITRRPNQTVGLELLTIYNTVEFACYDEDEKVPTQPQVIQR